MASRNRYSALATDAEIEREDFAREFAEASHVHILGSPKLSPRLKPDVDVHENESDLSRSFSLESDASARSFDSGTFGESPYRARNPPRGGFGGGARRVSFSEDIENVHDVDGDDCDGDDLSVSFTRLFDLDQSEEPNESVSESESGDELSRLTKKCESLHSENLYLAQQLRSMRMLVKSHRKKLDSQTRLVTDLKKEVSNLQESLWASITGTQQPRQSIFDGPTPLTASAAQRGRANTELGPSKPTPATRRRAHTEVDVGRLALPPNSPMPPPKSKKRPSRLSFSAFFGRSPSAEPAEDNEEGDTLIEEEKEVPPPSGSTVAMRVRAQSEVIPRPAPQDDADESRLRSKSYPSESDIPSRNNGNSFPALQRQVSVLESKLMSSRKKQGHYKHLEKKFLDMKLEHATKCAELEEMQMQFSVNVQEQQSVVSDLNTALVDKVNLKSQVEQLRDRLEELTKEYQLLQQNHRQLQNHIDVSSRKSSVSLATGGAPALPVATSWRVSLARRFSSLTSTVDDGEEVPQKSRERSKTHHGHHQRKKHRNNKKRSKHTRSKSEVTTGTIIKNGQHTDRKSLPPQPLHLVAKTPKPKEKLDVWTENPHADDSDEAIDGFVDGDIPLAQFRGWFGGASGNANVKGDTGSGGRTSLQEELLHATGSNSPLLTNKSVHVIL